MGFLLSFIKIRDQPMRRQVCLTMPPNGFILCDIVTFFQSQIEVFLFNDIKQLSRITISVNSSKTGEITTININKGITKYAKVITSLGCLYRSACTLTGPPHLAFEFLMCDSPLHSFEGSYLMVATSEVLARLSLIHISEPTRRS